MSERIALISDIHGNLPALEAVLNDIDGFRPDRIVCLGDTVGYGPFPRQCFELVASVADLMLAGNHEAEAASDTADEGTEDDARELAEWAGAQLRELEPWERLRSAIRAGRLDALAFHQEKDKGLTFVHGAPEKPAIRYVWPGYRTHYIQLNRQLDQHLLELLRQFDTGHGFCGHTHVPAILMHYENRDLIPISQDWNRRLTFVGPQTVFFVPEKEALIDRIDGRRMVINPGSVGQPRDLNPMASWALYEGDSVRFRRVPYEISVTQAALHKLPVSESARTFQANRLLRGE